jgi:hypothetical protein
MLADVNADRGHRFVAARIFPFYGPCSHGAGDNVEKLDIMLVGIVTEVGDDIAQHGIIIVSRPTVGEHAPPSGVGTADVIAMMSHGCTAFGLMKAPSRDSK